MTTPILPELAQRFVELRALHDVHELEVLATSANGISALVLLRLVDGSAMPMLCSVALRLPDSAMH